VGEFPTAIVLTKKRIITGVRLGILTMREGRDRGGVWGGGGV